MASSPKVSIVLSYSSEDCRESLASILRQSYQDFELLILVNDPPGSELVPNLERQADQRATVHRIATGDLASARNLLTKHTTGTYLCDVHAAYQFHPEYLSRTVDILDHNPGVAFVGSRAETSGMPVQAFSRGIPCRLEELLCGNPFGPGALVRRAVVLTTGGYDDRLPHAADQEWDFWLRLLESGHEGLVLQDGSNEHQRPPAACLECTTPQARLEVVGYLARKHSRGYRNHLLQVLLQMGTLVRDARSANEQFEIELRRQLQPTVHSRQQDVALLERKLEAARTKRALQEAADSASSAQAALDRQNLELERVRAEYERTLSEIDGVRSSVSWRVTAPARRVSAALRRLRGANRQ